MGTPGDRPYSSTARAAPLGPRGTDRAPGLTDRPATSHRFDDPAARAGQGQVTPPAHGAEPAHLRSGELGVRPPAAGTGGLGQSRASRSKFADQLADHRRCPDEQGPGPARALWPAPTAPWRSVPPRLRAELTWTTLSPALASATRRQTRSLQACWRAGVTPCGPPGPGGGGCLPPPPGPTRPWPVPSCSRPGPAPRVRPG